MCLDQDNPACLGLFGSVLVLFVCLLALCGGKKKEEKDEIDAANVEQMCESQTGWPGG